MTWMSWLGLSLVMLAVVAWGLTIFGEHQWAGEVAALRAELERGCLDGEPEHGALAARHDARELEALPAPVQRYFRAVLKDGQPIITAVSIDMAGTFNMSARRAQWKPFTSRQRVTTLRPGFLWDAKVVALPGVTVRVVDSYIAGGGLLRAKVQGLLTMAEQQGRGDIAQGEFMRWLAEVPWYPTALLPSQGVRWEAVDAHSAYATVADGPLKVTLLFRFNEAGLIASFRAEARGAMVGNQLVMAPWEGSWSDYRAVDGVKVPFKGEVAWIQPAGRRPYFIGAVTALAFEFAG